jgi:hypothetical protein
MQSEELSPLLKAKNPNLGILDGLNESPKSAQDLNMQLIDKDIP